MGFAKLARLNYRSARSAIFTSGHIVTGNSWAVSEIAWKVKADWVGGCIDILGSNG